MKITTRKIAASLVAAALVGTGLMTLPACSSNDNKSNNANTENTVQENTNANSEQATDSNLITKDDISEAFPIYRSGESCQNIQYQYFNVQFFSDKTKLFHTQLPLMFFITIIISNFT